MMQVLSSSASDDSFLSIPHAERERERDESRIPHRDVGFSVYVEIGRLPESAVVCVEIQQRAALDEEVQANWAGASANFWSVEAQSKVCQSEDSLPSVYITLAASLIVQVHAAVALETARRAAEQANRGIERDTLAPRADHRLVLFQIQVVEHERKAC